jgi:hypothetical protein
MTDIEQKALALVNEIEHERGEDELTPRIMRGLIIDEALCRAIKQLEDLRQPTQSDALRDQLLQECLVKLRDVQGAEAPKQYACNLIKRIERVLQEQNK